MKKYLLRIFLLLTANMAMQEFAFAQTFQKAFEFGDRQMYKIIITNDSNYMVVGGQYPSLLKLNTNGDSIWAKNVWWH